MCLRTVVSGNLVPRHGPCGSGGGNTDGSHSGGRGWFPATGLFWRVPESQREFGLSMGAAWSLDRTPDLEHKLRRTRPLAISTNVLVLCNELVYAGRWQWVPAALLIVAGLSLPLAALAARLTPDGRTLRLFASRMPVG